MFGFRTVTMFQIQVKILLHLYLIRNINDLLSFSILQFVVRFHLHGSPTPMRVNLIVFPSSQTENHPPSIRFDLYVFVMLAHPWICNYSFKGCWVTCFPPPHHLTLSVCVFHAVSLPSLNSNGAPMMIKDA